MLCALYYDVLCMQSPSVSIRWRLVRGIVLCLLLFVHVHGLTPGFCTFPLLVTGALVILYDLKSVVNGVSVEVYFPFLGNYIGRALTILFFAVLCAQTYEYGGWTKLIVLYNLVVATLQGFVYFTTKTISPVQPHMEDLPDL